MGLTDSKHDPLIFYGITNGSNPSTIPCHPIHIGLYVDDLFFFSESDAEEARFKNLLNNQVITDFMGDADFSSAPLPNGSDALT